MVTVYVAVNVGLVASATAWTALLRAVDQAKDVLSASTVYVEMVGAARRLEPARRSLRASAVVVVAVAVRWAAPAM